MKRSFLFAVSLPFTFLVAMFFATDLQMVNKVLADAATTDPGTGTGFVFTSGEGAEGCEAEGEGGEGGEGGCEGGEGGEGA